MNDDLEFRSRHLAELLDEPLSTANDFIALALAGEAHRRFLSLSDPASAPSSAVQQRYDAVLAAFASAPLTDGPEIVPSSGLDDDLAAHLEALKSYASTHFRQRDPEEGEAILQHIDDVLLVACAGFGARAVSEQTVLHLSQTAAQVVASCALRLGDLWDHAVHRWTSRGTDQQFPELDDWLAPLARRSGLWQALTEARSLRSPARRRALIEQALERGVSRHEAKVIRVDFRRRVAFPVRMAADAGEENLDDPAFEGKILFDRDGVQVRIEEIPDPRDLERSFVCLRVRLAPGDTSDLTAEHAVTVESASGTRLVPIRTDAKPLRWWGEFTVQGTLRLRSSLLGLDLLVEVVRPGDA
jgi:hypothetical protein